MKINCRQQLLLKDVIKSPRGLRGLFYDHEKVLFEFFIGGGGGGGSVGG